MIPYSCLAVEKCVASVHFLLPDTSSPDVHTSFVGVLVKSVGPFSEIIIITPMIFISNILIKTGI
jgi:hypothetical protein